MSCRIIAGSADATVCDASIPIWFTSAMGPPGSWFLFAIDGEGVPSVAKTILLSQSKSIHVSSKTYDQKYALIISMV